MKIHVSINTVGRYGGGLKGLLRYLPKVIQSELDTSKFVSSFDELWLTLSYPPMYVLPGVVDMAEPFFKYFNSKLPSSRLNRKYRKIDITLRAPEFSEHFDLKDSDNYSDRFVIEERYKNLTEPDLGIILIDKYLEAGEIINSKIKKEDHFQFEQFRSVLLSLRKRISRHFLENIHSEQAAIVKDETLDRAIRIRDERRKTNTVKDKRIRDVRVYHHGFPNKALYPYDFQYVEIFRNLLRRSNLLCPTYHHLYIMASKTFEEGLRNSFSIEHWYVCGISVIDYEGYLKSTESEKEKLVVDLISNGLIDIATIDHLDISIIEDVIKMVNLKGLDTELVLTQVESKNHVLTITYLSRSMEEQCPVFFTVLDKKTNQSNKVQIGRAQSSDINLWLQKVSLTRNKINIKSSNSVWADVSLHDKARIMEFDIQEILNGTLISQP